MTPLAANTLFSSLLNDVYTHTNRPDLVNETVLAIRKATSKAHESDEFPEDMVYVTAKPSAGTNSNEYLLDVNSMPFIRHRKVLQVINSGTKRAYEQVSINDLFDSYGNLKHDCWYKAGLMYRINAALSATDTLDCIYLQYPEVFPETYFSWIALTHPEVIVEEAAGQVFKTVGKDTEYKYYAQLSAENFMRLKSLHIPALTY
jgi:hypothetical protein